MQPFNPVDAPAQQRVPGWIKNTFGMLRSFGASLWSVRTGVSLLLAAAVSALVVVADQIVSIWADGQLLLAWFALWSVLFAAFALFAEAVYGWSEVLASSFGGQSQAQQDKQAARQPSQGAERPPARDRGA